jgi:hypothetical protein
LSVVIAMTHRRLGIPGRARLNPWREFVHPIGEAGKRLDGMRLFYAIVTLLLFATLGLLEVVAARSVPVGP